MSTTTTNYNLIKPQLTDPADITAINPNWDILDSKLKTIDDSLSSIGSDIDGDYLPLSGGTVTGTVILAKVQDSAGNSYTMPALVVGGMPTTYHLELDNNEIQAKQNETTPGNLFLNSNGGKVSVGSGGLEIDNEGSVRPETAINGSVGTETIPWNKVYSRYLWVYGAANASYGGLRVGTTGTTSTAGTTVLDLGNATATGKENNSSGKITMYGSGTGFTNILPNTATSGSNSVTLPTATGTLAVMEYSTTNLTAKSSSLATGKMYLCYE